MFQLCNTPFTISTKPIEMFFRTLSCFSFLDKYEDWHLDDKAFWQKCYLFIPFFDRCVSFFDMLTLVSL